MSLLVKAERKKNPDYLPPGRNLAKSDGLEKVQLQARWSKIE